MLYSKIKHAVNSVLVILESVLLLYILVEGRGSYIRSSISARQ